jgi:NAD(P)-dependent dehydrogenase (short-subunit alcohol dehydrogenase family)
MSKTILITGASSGIGKATAEYFAARGWNVAATMRQPEREITLGALPNVKLYRLDVTDQATIAQTVTAVIQDFEKIDVVVNNAGYGAVGIFEKATEEQIEKQFATNVFGVMRVVRAILPHFRNNRAGTIVNVTSMGGRVTFPTYSVYHATKWAVEGWAESLAFELRPFNIRIKNVEPGAIKTDFYDRSLVVFANDELTDFDRYEQAVAVYMREAGDTAPGPEIVAKTIFRAATDSSWRLRYPARSQASFLLFLSWLFPLRWFQAAIRRAMGE